MSTANAASGTNATRNTNAKSLAAIIHNAAAGHRHSRPNAGLSNVAQAVLEMESQVKVKMKKKPPRSISGGRPAITSHNACYV